MDMIPITINLPTGFFFVVLCAMTIPPYDFWTGPRRQ
jgi:hypothetical protein